MTTLLETIISLYIASVSPTYAVSIDATNDYDIYVCDVPTHCDTMSDECLDTYQSFDTVNDCVNCSLENNPYSELCAELIPFDYRRYQNFTFAYDENTNVTVNLMQIIHDIDMFSIDDINAYIDVFASDCLANNELDVCYSALYVSSNLSLATLKRTEQ